MADDRPTATELIETVREFLHDRLLPTLSGHAAFEVRIAANLLAISLREQQRGPGAAAAERRRLVALLGRDGTLEELDAELVRRVRDGELGLDDEALRSHLRQAVADRLAIANPKYR